MAGLIHRATCLLVISSGLAVGDAVVVQGQTGAVRCPAAVSSRWSAGTSGYERSGEFGRAQNDWLQSATGLLATATGEVLVHDGVEAVVHRLTPDLQAQSRFGRRGGGPGEFTPLPGSFLLPGGFLHRYIAADDTLVYVFDGFVQAFREDGTFERSLIDLRRITTGPIDGVRALHAAGGDVYFAADVLTITPTGRHLETSRIGPDGETEVIHRLELSMPPMANGRIQIVGQQARPVWAARGSCAVIGDGASGWMLRLNLRSAQVDTIRLPDHEVEVRTSVPPPMMRRWQGRIPEPTAVWRWREVAIDPDGHLWVHPWRRPTTDAVIVYRIDPAGGVHEELVPAFPHAFGAPGVFYSLDRHRTTGEVLTVRYVRHRP